MDRKLIILKKENGPRASSAPALGLNTIIFKYVYWYMKQISGERLQDHWSSGFSKRTHKLCNAFLKFLNRCPATYYDPNAVFFLSSHLFVTANI